MVRLPPEARRLQAVRSTFAGLKFAPAAWVSCLSLIGSLFVNPSAWPLDLSVTTDEPVVVQNQRVIDARDQQSPQNRTSAYPDSDASRQVEDKTSLQLQQHKEQVNTSINSSLEEEERLMADVVQTLDRESASHWLAGFISSRPWNCPLRQQNDWIEAILNAVERNQIPMCKEILGLVATLISIESGFHADPLVVDPSGRGSIESLLKRVELKLFDEYGPLMPMPPIPKYYAAYKDKYWPQLLACHTESDVEVISRRLADELKKDAKYFPTPVRSVVDEKISKLANVVRSKGSMQLKLLRARPAMRNRGEEFTDEELTEYMYTINGGVDVGVAALKPMFVQYGARYAKKGDLSWLFFVGMDYHYGPFASRNMAEQLRIRDLSGQKIAIDGSFLNHDEEGRPEKQDSETLLAAAEACPSISKQSIFEVFRLERAPQYIYTDVHRSIVEAHRDRYREIPFAVVGEIRMGQSAEIKFGTKPTTRLYLNKLDRYLNSIPWDN
ncbi:MAG: DUF1615 family protein [Desulfomonilaceae bacterium]